MDSLRHELGSKTRTGKTRMHSHRRGMALLLGAAGLYMCVAAHAGQAHNLSMIAFCSLLPLRPSRAVLGAGISK